MSTAARKARKRSGEKFTREPKVGTPLMRRQEFVWVWDPIDKVRKFRSMASRDRMLSGRSIEDASK